MLTAKRIDGKLHLAQWIEFSDNFGSGWAQPDAFIVTQSRVVLFECKLTQTPVAFLQMRELYAPLLRKIFNREVVCIQVCKNLVNLDERVFIDYSPAMSDGATWVWL